LPLADSEPRRARIAIGCRIAVHPRISEANAKNDWGDLRER
jgi:hypothetical protein